MGLLAHLFSSCNATLAKATFIFELASDWIENADPMRRGCGYGLIYELSIDLRKPVLTNEFFPGCIDRVRSHFVNEDTWTRMAMGTALMGIGKRNKVWG